MGLRSLGWDILAVSIAPCDRPAEKLTPEEAGENARTLHIKTSGAGAIIGAIARCFFRNPVRFFQVLWFALRLGHPTGRRLLFNLLYFAEAAVAGDWITSRQYTHVHVHFASTVALILKRLYSVSFSVTMHGPDEFVDPVGFALTPKIEGAAFLVAISHFACSQLMRWSEHRHWQKFEVCRLGVDPQLFERRLPAASDRDPVRLLCVGRLAPVKGQHILLQAIHRIVSLGYRNFRLSIAGGGPDQASLEQRILELDLGAYVRLEGWLNQDKVRELYAQTDIFVLASFAEGVPVVLMEAMAMQIPCVTTAINGIPELIDDGVDGLLAPAADEEGFAAAITRLLTNPELRVQMGAAGRRKILDRYNLRFNIEALAGIFERRLGSPSARDGVRANFSIPAPRKGAPAPKSHVPAPPSRVPSDSSPPG